MGANSLERVERKYGWDVAKLKRESQWTNTKQIVEINVNDIRRPLQGSRSNDQEKVEALKLSIQEHGLLEPIDVLLVDGVYYGFSGCHRYQAHQEIGKETIFCRVRKATKQTLRFHMM
jgi:sulfiredoxin